jgi:hypothetical protein
MLNTLIYLLLGAAILTLIVMLVRELARGKNEAGPGQAAQAGIPLPSPNAAPKEASWNLEQSDPAPTAYGPALPRQKPFPKGISVAFSAVFVLVGLGVLAWGIHLTLQGLTSQNWPAVQGTIISSEIQESEDSDSGTVYGASVRYAYRVDGIDYTGSKVSFADISASDSSIAIRVVGRYPAGRSVAVYYDPAQPKTAVLETGVSGNFLLLYVIGGMFVVIPLVIIYATLKAKPV